MKATKSFLSALVKKVISEIRHEFGGRNINFEVSSLPTVECDYGLMKQVSWNLTSNAIKFTSARENALIEIGQQHRDGTNAFFIRDNGAGFDMKYMEKLFAPFQRLHSQEQFAGTGSLPAKVTSRHRRVANR